MAKDDAGALADFSKAVELDPRFAIAYIDRGNARSRLRHLARADLVAAKGDFTKALEAAPSDSVRAQAYETRGTTRLLLGDYAGAIEDTSKALEIEPRRADAYLYRSAARSLLGDEAGARADQEKALENEQDPAKRARIQRSLQGS